MTLAHPTTVNGYSTIGGDLPSLGLNYELNGHAAESLVSAVSPPPYIGKAKPDFKLCFVCKVLC